MTTLRLARVAAALLALSAGAAQAALVSTWTVDVVSAFDPASIVDTNGNTPGGITISNSNRTLRWGVDIGNGQSGLDISNSPSSQQVNTNGAAVANVAVTHINQPVQAPSLDRVNIDSTLTLTPFVPLLPGLPPATITFQINFLETTNAGAICADGAPNNVGVNINGCADIFVIDQSSLNFPFTYDTGDGINQQYFISFFEQTGGLTPLSAAACLAVTGVNGPCLGFETPESANTTFNFAALITTERVVLVPEPGSLALLGLSLAAAGWARRRKALLG